MSKLNKFAKDRDKHDLVNLSDEIRRPAVAKFIVDRIEKVKQSVRDIDIETSVETDFNIAASLTYGALKLEAKESGPFGNLISLTVVDGATLGAAEVEVINDSDIVIMIEDGVTDYDTVKAAIEASDADQLVSVTVTGLGTDVAELSSQVSLEGGE
jgi:hypothetical protein